jgi:hypothetical protein
MKTYYQARGWMKFAEVDDWEQGCLRQGGTCTEGNDTFRAPTIGALVEKLRLFCDADAEGVLLDSCDELGRVDIQKMENADGLTPTDAEEVAWKMGELKLWAATYTFRVEKISAETVTLITTEDK